MDALQTKTKVKTKHEEVPVTKKKITGSEVLLQCLVNEGVTTLFGYPGGAIMPVYDALYSYADKLNHILVRHEQGAVHAAQGYARATGGVGVALATSGPGATNLVTGLADALIDSTPIVCITGQVFAHLLGTDAFQEIDVINTTIPLTKWNIQVTEAKDIAPAVAKAFYIAKTGRPGPVLIDITKNAQNELIEEAEYSKCESIRTYRPKPVLSMAQVETAANLINKASRPYILAGQGIILSGASKELIAFSEKTGIPVACTLLGLGCISYGSSALRRISRMHGNYAPNVNTNECDLLIGIGMRFDDRVTGNVAKYAKQAQVIHIDIDKAEINKIIKADVAVHADAKEALTALISKCDKKSHPLWLKSFRHLDDIEQEKVIEKDIHPQGSVTMAEVVHKISELTKGEAILVTDVGQHQMVASRYYKFKTPLTQITSGGAGHYGLRIACSHGRKNGQAR